MKKKAKVGDRIRLSDLLRIRDGRTNIPGEAYTVLEITEGQAAVPLFALSGMLLWFKSVIAMTTCGASMAAPIGVRALTGSVRKEHIAKGFKCLSFRQQSVVDYEEPVKDSYVFLCNVFFGRCKRENHPFTARSSCNKINGNVVVVLACVGLYILRGFWQFSSFNNS